MNYKHNYHAGNFADVFKHIILTALLQSFLHKDKAICYLESHAGLPFTDLKSAASQKSKEYENGIAKIYDVTDAPLIAKDYFTIIHGFNNQKTSLKYYPGSTYFAHKILRPQDRLMFADIQKDEANALKNYFDKDKRIQIKNEDGYLMLKANLPPKERRGLVLIDPPFEKPDEFDYLTKFLPEILKRWETGMFAIWYPIKQRGLVNRFYDDLKKTIKLNMLSIEISILDNPLSTHLSACGMLIINPPWQPKDELKQALIWLKDKLNIQNGMLDYNSL